MWARGAPGECFEAILLFNPAAERIFSCTAAQAIGQSVARFGTPEGVAARAQMIEQLARDPKQVVFYGEDGGILAKRWDGSLFLHEVHSRAAKPAGASSTR